MLRICDDWKHVRTIALQMDIRRAIEMAMAADVTGAPRNAETGRRFSISKKKNKTKLFLFIYF